jgi:hypothetical protein
MADRYNETSVVSKMITGKVNKLYMALRRGLIQTMDGHLFKIPETGNCFWGYYEQILFKCLKSRSVP